MPSCLHHLIPFLHQPNDGPGDYPQLQEDADPPDIAICAEPIDPVWGVNGNRLLREDQFAGD